MKVGMYIMAPELIKNFTLSVPPSPLISSFFYAVRIVSKESRRLVPPELLIFFIRKHLLMFRNIFPLQGVGSLAKLVMLRTFYVRDESCFLVGKFKW
jgi:hypothetical protein